VETRAGVSAAVARLERALLPLVLVVTALGLLLPAPARAVGDANGITIALVVLVAAVGLGLPLTAVADARRHSRRLLVVVVVPLLGLPALAWATSRLLPPGALQDGILAVGVAPAEVATVALAALAGASAALAAAVLIGSTLGTVLLAGPVLHVLAPGSSHFSTLALLVSLLGIIALPLAAAMTVRAALPTARRHHADQVSSAAASLAVLVLIWLVAGQAHLGQAYLLAGLALLLFLAGSALLGAALTRGLPHPIRTALVLPVALRDFAIAAGIATRAFGAPAAAALGIYGVLVLALGTATTRIAHRR
jgi:ACR3 family arsenite efflux pump ArsB